MSLPRLGCHSRGAPRGSPRGGTGGEDADEMRRLSGFLLAIGWITLGGALPASAAILSLESSTLELRLSAACSGQSFNCSGTHLLPPIEMAQNPASLSVAVNATGGFSLPAGLFSGSAAYATPATDFQMLGVPMISSLNITAVNDVGNFTSRGGPALNAGGKMPLSGFARLGILGIPPVAINLAALGQDAQTLAMVGQLSVLVDGGDFGAGAARVSGIVTTLTRRTPGDTVGCPPLVCGPGFGPITVVTTIGTATFTRLKTATFVELAGADSRTPGFLGTLALVSPIIVVVAGNEVVTFPGFLTATLHFVPEPGTLTLFASGALGFFGIGLRRKQRRATSADAS